MLQRLEPEERLQGADRVIIIAIGAIIFGGFALDLLVDFAWLKAGALVMFFAWVGLIVVHELGHAAMAAALGWRVCRIVIGMGKPLLRFRAFGVPIQICRYPVGGHVVPAPLTADGAGWKSSLIYMAGPGAELLVLLALLALFGFEQLTGTPTSFLVLSAQATALAAILGVVFNLIPLTTREGGITDGLGIVLSPWLSQESFQERQALPFTTAAESLLLAGRPGRAAEVLRDGVEQLRDNLPATVRLALALLDAADPEATVHVLDPLVKRDDIPESLQPAILATLSTALLWTTQDRLDDADAYTQFAMTRAPDSPSIRLARARVLLELGQLHAALAILPEVQGPVPDERLIDARDVMRARIEVKRGQRAAALELVRALEARGARGFELDRLRQELGISEEVSQKPA
jgi:hypothetical protein